MGERLDFVILGVGTDGHTASLFPGEKSLEERHQTVLPSQAPADTPATQRLTLSFASINNAREIAVLLVGKSKRDVVAKLKDTEMGKGPVHEMPIFGVRPTEGMLSWYTDTDAYGAGRA
mmetsp:Transcript_19643/g.32843  ORF Transcript_19643/g.32843 Transcript_19643/m.32843 type:complete len:119 (+) Transcript_19643:1-357(+)